MNPTKTSANSIQPSRVHCSPASAGSVPTGWVCPKCGRALAPWVMECNCHIRFEIVPPTPTKWEPERPYTGDPLPGQEPTTVCGTPNKRISNSDNS